MIDELVWDRTRIMRQRLEDKIVDGYYMGRPVISRDTPVDGGVYLSGRRGVAIVVDSKKSKMLMQMYEAAKEKASFGGKVRKEFVLEAVYNTVWKTITNGEKRDVDTLVAGLGGKNDQKVSLDVFLRNGVGYCTHCALACAALLEMFKRDGLISGKASVDRNYIPNLRGHAWCRYTNSGGEVFVLDVGKNFIGTLGEAVKKRIYPYSRPEDKLEVAK